MPAISVMMKPSSGMCNMQCDYCFYCDEAKKREQESYGFMSEETLEAIMEKVFSYAEYNVSMAFQGGEPTLRGLEFFEKAMELEKKYNVKKVPVQHALQTNGMLLSDEWCSFLKKYGFLVGVSVDGTKKTHDRYRHDRVGAPTYDIVTGNIRLLEKHEVDFNILTVVNRETAKNVREIYEEYKKNHWMFQQYIACLDPIDDARGQMDYSMTPGQYGKFLVKLFDLWYRDLQNGTQPYIRQFENYIAILVGREPEACNQRGTCGIQNVIEADGSVYPCDFYMLDEYRLGNLKENTMEQIDEKRKEMRFVERSFRVEEKCRECRYFSICRGGCQRDREFNSLKGTYSNYFCSAYTYFFEHRLEDLMHIAEEIKRQL